MLFLKAGSTVHGIYVFSLPEILVKNLVNSPVQNQVKIWPTIWVRPKYCFCDFCVVFFFVFAVLGGPDGGFGAPGDDFLVLVAVVACHYFYYY